MKDKKGSDVIKISAFISLFLSIIKTSIGFLTNTPVLISDALDNLADLGVMIASWFGLRIAQREPDERFPYGYYKVESITSLFISLFIIYASFELIKTGWSRLFKISVINNLSIAFFGGFVSVIGSYFLHYYLKKEGKKINSELLLTNSEERLGDFYKSFLVLITIGLNYFTIPYIDGIITILLSLMVFKIGLVSLKNSVFSLMDVSPEPEIDKQVREVIKGVKGVRQVKSLRLRKAGSFIFGEAVISVKKSAKVHKAHIISDKVEEKLSEEVGRINSLLVHVEPYKDDEHEIVIPVSDKKGVDSKLSEHFGRADYFIIVKIGKKGIESKRFVKNKFKGKEVRAGLNAATFLIEEKIDTLITKEIGQISFHTLRDNLITIYKTDKNEVKQVLEDFNNNELKKMLVYTREKK